ncbi:MAG: extracellular solute-binding protein [Herbinix sp.]|nr:extracellular solute-binding protein [Herbinix sp.]
MNIRQVYIGIILGAAFLVGCGSTTRMQEAGGQEEIPIVRIGIGSYGKTTQDLDIVNQELGRLSEEKAGVRMLLVPVSSRNTSMMLNDTENPVDIVSLTNEAYNAQKTSLLPISNLLYEYGQDIINFMGDDIINLGKIEGELYGIPKPMPDVHCTGVAVLTEYLNKYRIDITGIRSMSDFEAVLAIIKSNEPELIPYVPERVNKEAIVREVIGDVLAESLAMVYYKDTSLEVVNLYETPEYEQRVRMVRDWYLKGYLSEDIIINNESGLSQVDAGYAFSTEYVIRPDELQAAKKRYGNKITYINFSERPYISTSSNTVYFWCINKQFENGQAAMKALNLLYTDVDIINTVLYGVEGIHYVKTGDGHITYPEGLTSETIGYSNNSKWCYNRNIAKVWEGGELNIYDIMKEFNASAIQSPAYGFQFEDEKLSFDPTKLSQVIKKYNLKLGDGVLDVDTALPQFQQELREAGAEQLVEEVQKQVEEWEKMGKKP